MTAWLERSSKFVFVTSKGQFIHLDEDTNDTWKKYAEPLRKTLDGSNVGNELRQIQFVDNMDDAGDCRTDVVDGELVVTIRVKSFLLGFRDGDFFLPYSEDKCKECCETLAHELVHARNAIGIAGKYGVEELTAIKKDCLSLTGWMILDEYSACKETAEHYGAFKSFERIERWLDQVPRDLCWILSERLRIQPFLLIKNLYYAAATRCAFADVSGNDKDHLPKPDFHKGRSNVMSFIGGVRRTLAETCTNMPLNKEQYESLGHRLIVMLLRDLCGVKAQDMEWAIEKLVAIQKRLSDQPA